MIRFTPPELSEGNSDPIDYDPLDYTLFGPGFWPVFPDLDIHAAGQGGLAGGGFNELGAARGAINAAGSALSIGAGANNVAAGCFAVNRGDGNIRVSFGDVCQEMDNSGGTLAAATFWHNGQTTVVNGTTFLHMITGTVMNNDSANALPFLTNSTCFYIIQVHEILHAVGMGHSADPNAVMFPSISNSCFNTQIPLDADDIAGLVFIYPGGGGGGGNGPPNAPTNINNVVTPNGNGTFDVVISWDAPATISVEGASAAASYIFEADVTATGKALVDTNIGNVTSLSASDVPNNTYYARVRGVDALGNPGVASGTTTIIGNAGGCTAAPAAPTNVSFTANNGTVTIDWTDASGGVNAATTFFVEAGAASGGSELANSRLGLTTRLVANGVGAGTYFVRIVAGNLCDTTDGPEIIIVVS